MPSASPAWASQLTTWLVGAESLAARILRRAVHPLHGPGLPGRKPGHDRDHRAAALSGAAEIRHRSGVVRHHPGAVHRARADLAADRHQPVRDPEHLGRQAVRHRLGHDPVPSADVRPAGRCWYSGPRSRCGCPIIWVRLHDRPTRFLSDRPAHARRPAIARCASAWQRPASSWRPAATTASPRGWSRSRASTPPTSPAPASR